MKVLLPNLWYFFCLSAIRQILPCQDYFSLCPSKMNRLHRCHQYSLTALFNSIVSFFSRVASFPTPNKTASFPLELSFLILDWIRALLRELREVVVWPSPNLEIIKFYLSLICSSYFLNYRKRRFEFCFYRLFLV